MAAYRRVYDSCHLQADCQEPGSAPEPYTLGNRVWATFTFFTFPPLFDAGELETSRASVKNLLQSSQKIFLSVYVTWWRCSMLCTQNYSLCYGFTIMTSCCLCNVYRPPWCRQVCSEVCLYRCSFVRSSHANLMMLLTLNGTWTAYNTESTPTWSVSLLTYLL